MLRYIGQKVFTLQALSVYNYGLDFCRDVMSVIRQDGSDAYRQYHSVRLRKCGEESLRAWIPGIVADNQKTTRRFWPER